MSGILLVHYSPRLYLETCVVFTCSYDTHAPRTGFLSRSSKLDDVFARVSNFTSLASFAACSHCVFSPRHSTSFVLILFLPNTSPVLFSSRVFPSVLRSRSLLSVSYSFQAISLLLCLSEVSASAQLPQSICITAVFLRSKNSKHSTCKYKQKHSYPRFISSLIILICICVCWSVYLFIPHSLQTFLFSLCACLLAC